MGRAFSPHGIWADISWGVAPGWVSLRRWRKKSPKASPQAGIVLRRWRGKTPNASAPGRDGAMPLVFELAPDAVAPLALKGSILKT